VERGVLSRSVIAGIRLSLRALSVIAGLTRNPVVAWHWIPDVETPDLIRGRDDNLGVRDDNLGVRDDIVIAGLTRNPVVAWHWIPDQVRDDNLGVRDDNLGVRDDN
jgi:hypothetical protein